MGFYSQHSSFKAGCSSQYRLRGHSSIFIFSTLIFEAGYFNSPDCEDIFFLFFPVLAKSLQSLMQYEDIWTFLHLWHPWISRGSCN